MAKNNQLAPTSYSADLLDSLPERSEPRCNICNSASRKKVDRLITASFSYTAVAEELQQFDDEFKHKDINTIRKNVERHAKRHVNLRERAIRAAVEKRAIEAGMLVDSEPGSLTTGRAFLDLAIQRATEQITHPDSKIRYADAIEAIKMLEDVQRSEYIHQLEVMQRQVWAISEAVKELVPPPKLPELIERARELFDRPTLELER